jgi:hypothetical protein
VTRSRLFPSIEIEGSVSLAGTCTIDVNKSLVFSYDLVGFVSHLTFGGTLRMNVAGPALVAGDAFPIFNFTTASGAFDRIEPASPGAGLVWDLSNLTFDGTVRVAVLAQPGFAETFFTPDGIVMTGTNGAQARRISY